MEGGMYMSLEEAKVAAHEKAINEGYDQLIFFIKKRKYDIKRITKKDNTRPSKLVGFVRIFYKDHQLFTRYMEVKEVNAE